MEEIKNKNASIDYVYKIIITEILCVLIIIGGITVIKYLFADTYKDLKVWYEEYICDETSINEVMEEIENEI